MGTVDLVFDLSSEGLQDPGSLQLLFERNGDDFRSLELPPVAGTYDAAQQTLTFTGVRLEDGDLITLGANNLSLPVEYLYFEAEPLTHGVALRWGTAVEVNNSHFTIERSADAVRFEALTEVSGHGDSQMSRAYEATDPAPLPGRAYYRLRQTDFDGSSSYSAMVEVSFDAAPVGLQVYPNPVKAGEVARLGYEQREAGTFSVQLLSLEGRVLWETSQAGPAGAGEVLLPAANWPAGTYLLRWQQGDEQQTLRWVIR
jgi:hypothetical protein